MYSLYIDPGTGSMLFTILIGVVTAAYFAIQQLKVKINFYLHGGKTLDNTDKDSESTPFVIFSDSKRYWNVFKPICDEFERRGLHCLYLTASEDDPALVEDYRYITCTYAGNGNKAFAKLNFLKADICLSTTPALEVYQWKRSKNTKFYAHILHEVGGGCEYEMFGLDWYDSVLLSGEFQKEEIRKIESKRSIKSKELVVVGSTYMDEMEKKVKHMTFGNNAKPVILVAPTWGKNAILMKYGADFLKAIKNTGYNIIVRPHPQSIISEPDILKKLMLEFPENDSFEWNFDNNNLEVLGRSDIMISDVSGVIFDYTLIFGKPLIYANAEWNNSALDSCWLDEPTWRLHAISELGYSLKKEDFNNIKNIIDSLLREKEITTKQNIIKNMCWQNRGNAASSVVDYLVSKREEIIK